MYYIKIRDEGMLIIPDNQGKTFLEEWQNGELPKVITIKDISFLSRNILSIKKQNTDSEQQPYEMSDEQLSQNMKKFWEAYQRAKKIPLADYSKNTQIYPYHSPMIVHTFACEGVVVRQDSDDEYSGDYFVATVPGTDGRPVILPYLELNFSFRCYYELLSRKETPLSQPDLTKKKKDLFKIPKPTS